MLKLYNFPNLPHPSIDAHMNILLITHHYEPEIGAPQRRWSALVQRLTAQGHGVTVLCPSPHYPERVSTSSLRSSDNKPFTRELGRHGETIIRMPYLLHGYSALARTIDQAVTAGASVATALLTAVHHWGRDEKPFDVVISTVPGIPSLFAGTLTSSILGIPHVAEMRDAWPDVVTGDLRSQQDPIPLPKKLIKKAIYDVVTHWQLRADAAVTTTEWFGSVLRARGLRNVFCIPNGANFQDFAHIPALEANARAGSLKIQYVGTVGRSQGLDVLVRAVKILQEKRPDIQCETRVIGGGSEVPALRELNDELGTKVEFIDPVAREELAEIYAWADIEFVSLRKTKPFLWTVPSKIFELMATRRFIVGAVEGSAAALLKESGVASVVESENAQALADELERLADHPELLAVESSGVELVLEQYSYESMAERYEEILNKVVSGIARRTANEGGAPRMWNVFSDQLAHFSLRSSTPESGFEKTTDEAWAADSAHPTKVHQVA